MSFRDTLEHLLGKQPNELELEAFSFFDMEKMTPEKLFTMENETMPLFLNVDDTRLTYLSVKKTPEECILDLCSRRIQPVFSASNTEATVMGGLAKVEQQKPSVKNDKTYSLFYLPLKKDMIKYDKLKVFASAAATIYPVWNESIWERICQICVTTKSGCHVTLSKKRCFSPDSTGLLCCVHENNLEKFNDLAAELSILPLFVGKTLSFPVLSYDCSLINMALEIPVSGLKKIMAQRLAKRRGMDIPTLSLSQETEESEEITPTDKDIKDLIKHMNRRDDLSFNVSMDLAPGDPKIALSVVTSEGTAMTENGLQLLMMRGILNLKLKQQHIVAASYVLSSSCEHPAASRSLLTPLLHTAKLFGVPVSNGICVPGQTGMTLFFITRPYSHTLPENFVEENDFITLLGDANGPLQGSIYHAMKNKNDTYDPPGVMTGTAAAILDVVKDAREQNILHSVSHIGRGGLAAALYTACKNGLGAKIYSERKSPRDQFLFGEPQAAALLTLPEHKLMDFARICSIYNLSSVTIGRVSAEKNLDINGWINIIPSEIKD